MTRYGGGLERFARMISLRALGRQSTANRLRVVGRRPDVANAFGRDHSSIPLMERTVEPVGRIKRAEILGSAGAGILGMGLGAMLSDRVSAVAVPLVALGASMHALGMWQRHRLDLAVGAELPRWSNALYWSCWGALLLVGAYLLIAAPSSAIP